MNAKEQEVLIARRMQGFLPTIEIFGQPFYIDIRMRELRAVDDFSKSLSFRSMERDQLTDEMSFLYDPKEKCIFIPNADQPAVAEKPVIIMLPPEIKMDPIGTARRRGYDTGLTLKEFPIQKELKAEVFEFDREPIFYDLERLSPVNIHHSPKITPDEARKIKRNVTKRKGRHL